MRMMLLKRRLARREDVESSASIGRGKVVSLTHPIRVIVCRSSPFPVCLSDDFFTRADENYSMKVSRRRQRRLFSFSPPAFFRQARVFPHLSGSLSVNSN